MKVSPAVKLFWGGLVLIIILVAKIAFTFPDENLHIIACNVGQGDGFLIYKGNTQIIVDGGPTDAITRCVQNHMPFWDNTLELVILTNPDHDHYFGLINLVKTYNVDHFVANAIEKPGEEYKALVDTVVSKSITISNPLTSTQMRVDNLVLDFVWPTAEAISEEYAITHETGVLGVYTSSRSINDLSLIFNLKYGEFDALFTGDIEPTAIDEVIQTGKIIDTDYLKVPHHGSKNGLNQKLLDESKPEIAVMSLGKNNRYGHPSPEVIDMLKAANVPTKRTDIAGEVKVVSDGKTWWLAK